MAPWTTTGRRGRFQSRIIVGAVIVSLAGCLRTRAPRLSRVGPASGPMAAATVVVDAGHGGRDTGAPGIGPILEKQVNLAIATSVAERLRRAGVRVISTRQEDRYLSLDERARAAERSGADLLVSVHADSAPDPRATGATVYIAFGARPASELAARRIEASLAAAGLVTRGVRPAGFRVLVGHSRPAVLVECGYLTNEKEASQLASEEYQARVAAAIAAGVADYLDSRGR